MEVQLLSLLTTSLDVVSGKWNLDTSGANAPGRIIESLGGSRGILNAMEN
jgi:hypothetical protein